MQYISYFLALFLFASSMYAEESFSMIKPRAVTEQHIGAIIDQIESSGLKVVALKMVKFETALAKQFYAEHEGKPFFDALIQKMTSGPVVAMVIEGEDAVRRLRTLVGATNPEQAAPNTIRARFGKGVTENAIHASDSVASAKREIALVFQPTEVFAAP